MGLDDSHYPSIVRILHYIKNTSQIINRSTAQTVATSVIYFYICLQPVLKAQLGMTKSKFSDTVFLSEITITKHINEIASITKQTLH